MQRSVRSRPAIMRRGFTLIELLMVIAIIGILSAIALSALSQARGKGNDAAVKAALNQATRQAELFYQANGSQYVITPGSTNDVCAPGATIAGQDSAYAQVKSAADAAGVTLNVSRTVASSVANPAACHACTPADASCAATSKGNFAAIVKLSDGSAFCVDSLGFSGTTTLTALSGGKAICQ